MRKLIFTVLFLIPAMLFANGAGEDDGRVHITWWHSNSGVIGEASDQLVEDFNEGIGAQEGIVVEAIYQGSANDTLTKLRTVAQGDDVSQLPDLVQLDATGVVDMAGNRHLYYMEDLAADQGEDLSFALDHALESMRYQGKVIVLQQDALRLPWPRAAEDAGQSDRHGALTDTARQLRQCDALCDRKRSDDL